MEVVNQYRGLHKNTLPTLYENDKEQNFSPLEISRYSNFSLNTEITKTWNFFNSQQQKYSEPLPKKALSPRYDMQHIDTYICKRPSPDKALSIVVAPRKVISPGIAKALEKISDKAPLKNSKTSSGSSVKTGNVTKASGAALAGSVAKATRPKLTLDELINAFEDPNNDMLSPTLCRSTTTGSSSGSYTVPSLPRSISNESGDADDFVKIINNAHNDSDDSDNEEDFKRVINSIRTVKRRNKNKTKSIDNKSISVNSTNSALSAISESETLFCNNENLVYKKFGRFISIEINGIKKIYDIFDIHRNSIPFPISPPEINILERKNDLENTKPQKSNRGFFKRILRFFKKRN